MPCTLLRRRTNNKIETLPKTTTRWKSMNGSGTSPTYVLSSKFTSLPPRRNAGSYISVAGQVYDSLHLLTYGCYLPPLCVHVLGHILCYAPQHSLRWQPFKGGHIFLPSSVPHVADYLQLGPDTSSRPPHARLPVSA